MFRPSLLLCCVAIASASVLVTDRLHPCLAQGNGTLFNLTALGQLQTTAGKYTFTFDCGGLQGDDCGGSGDPVAVCQKNTKLGVSCVKHAPSPATAAGELLRPLPLPPPACRAYSHTHAPPSRPRPAPAAPIARRHRCCSWNAGSTATALWFADYNFFPADQGGRDSNFTVMYTDNIRVSRVRFVLDDSVKTPALRFLGEAPYTEYNFEVRGSGWVSRR